MAATTELKIISDTGSSFKVGGYGVVFGGHDASESKDRFTAQTDFWFDRITATPMVMYQHGQDGTLKRAVVGRVTSTKPDDIGLWVEAQISTAKHYAAAIRQLIAKGVLGWSSGAVPHLVDRGPSDTPGVKEITSWPIVELSLTPNPAEYRTVGVKELKSLAAADPLLLPIAREAEQKEAKAVTDLPDSAFAFIEPGGTLDDEAKTFPRAKRHYAHHNEAGDVDVDALTAAIAQARKSTEPTVLAHLMRHAHALDSGGHDDAHTKSWSEGAAPRLLVVSAKIAALSEEVAKEHDSMTHLGMDTKGGQRIRAELCQQLEEVERDFHDVLKWAHTVDRGEDGRARVDLLRQKLALFELEV